MTWTAPFWKFPQETRKNFCAFTMAWKRFRYISEVSHKYNNHMTISTNLGTSSTTSALVLILFLTLHNLGFITAHSSLITAQIWSATPLF